MVAGCSSRKNGACIYGTLSICMLLIISDSMDQPQMDWDRSGNISNLDLVEPNQIRDSVHVCNILLFSNFLMLKMSHTCIYCSPT